MMNSCSFECYLTMTHCAAVEETDSSTLSPAARAAMATSRSRAVAAEPAPEPQQATPQPSSGLFF